MKNIRRSRRLRLPRRRHQLTKPITSDEDDESDREYRKSIIRSNQNANRIATTLFDTSPTISVEEKQHQPLQRSSDQSSLFLYSINSIQKPAVSSDDLTPLTRTTTNTTPLTALSFSNTKQTEIGTVKIDLTDLSDSSSTNSDHDQSLSLDRKISIENINCKMKPMKDRNIQSITFSKDSSFDQKHASCFTIPNVENGDCMTKTSPSSFIEDAPLSTTINTNRITCQQSFIKWNLQNMTNKMKLLIGCSSLGLIAGILILVIIL
jgi:hypothetical protein